MMPAEELQTFGSRLGYYLPVFSAMGPSNQTAAS